MFTYTRGQCLILCTSKERWRSIDLLNRNQLPSNYLALNDIWSWLFIYRWHQYWLRFTVDYCQVNSSVEESNWFKICLKVLFSDLRKLENAYHPLLCYRTNDLLFYSSLWIFSIFSLQSCAFDWRVFTQHNKTYLRYYCYFILYRIYLRLDRAIDTLKGRNKTLVRTKTLLSKLRGLKINWIKAQIFSVFTQICQFDRLFWVTTPVIQNRVWCAPFIYIYFLLLKSAYKCWSTLESF